MPLPVAHSLVGASIVAALVPQIPSSHQSKSLLIGACFALCPDFDFLLLWLLHYETAHRGFTHSFAFAGVACLGALALLRRTRLKTVLVYGLAFMSHGVLDYLTTRAGQGVELLWPFSSERLRFGLWDISKSPFDLPAEDILIALLIEAAIFAPPLLGILLVRRRVKANSIL
jgi:membrane-bound metal-dependent hydrolase YbcI (DUF457 family)